MSLKNTNKSKLFLWKTKFNSGGRPDFSTSKFSYEINKGMEACESEVDMFIKQYLIWKVKMKSIYSALTNLVEKVHNEQLKFNKANLLFKEINVASRLMRTDTYSLIDMCASVSSFVTDAVSGITSVVQACNVDSHMKEFGKIMELYAKITQPLYFARSNCFSEYRNVEEIIRRYHSETFGTTLNRITKAIKTEDMWVELKTAKHDNNINKVCNKVDLFFEQLSNTKMFNEIRCDVENYFDSNPAALEACESTGKALYGFCDVYTRNWKVRDSLVSRGVNTVGNVALIQKTNSEIEKLKILVSNDLEPQAKLESKIREAICDLKSEATEMERRYDEATEMKRRYDEATKIRQLYEKQYRETQLKLFILLIFSLIALCYFIVQTWTITNLCIPFCVLCLVFGVEF